MGKIYDDLTDAQRGLADTYVETKGLDPELAAVAAIGPAGSVDVITGATDAAKAAGVTEQAAKGAAGGGAGDVDVETVARIKILDGELKELGDAYADAVKGNRIGHLIGLKNKITAAGQEKAALETSALMARVAAGGE